MKLLNVVGARPNMMKMAPIVEAAAQYPDIEQRLLHTGQHYDERMSQIFFDELGLPQPDIYLGVGSASHAVQTARIMIAFEEVLKTYAPDVVVVVGDVNSTVACTLTAAKMHIPVAHVEAGLRSFDRQMPEEINRLVTDTIADLLFTTSRRANEHLQREGIPEKRIYFVGNVMIDTLNKHRPQAAQMDTAASLGVKGAYALLTLHRPSNVDVPEIFDGILKALLEIQQQIPIIFPIHPRTQKRLEEFGFQQRVAAADQLHLIQPQGYFNFLDLMMHAKMVITDSGGIQEETTCLGVPCLTVRENTERPITITEGSNKLVGTDPQKIGATAQTILEGGGKAGEIPELWDGHAAERIMAVLYEHFGRGHK